MKLSNLLLFLMILSTISCSASTNYRKDSARINVIPQTNENKSFEKSGFIKVHSLKKSDNSFIGDVYAKFINDSIFTDLYVINERDTLYKIDKCNLLNIKGKDINISCDEFWGYKFILKKKDYIVISYLSNKGKNVSDDITIEWNNLDGMLEIMKEP
jgi:hypothetical protein